MAMDGRAARDRTSLFDAELGANLCEQVFQLVHFSFETGDVGLHRREFRDAEGWGTQPLNRPLRMTEPLALPREDASSGSRASPAGAEAA